MATEAEIYYTEATTRYMLLLSAISTYRQFVEWGSPLAEATFKEKHQATHGFDNAKKMAALQAASAQGGVDFQKEANEYIAFATSSDVAEARQVVNASSLVFAHSVVDAVLLDFCRVSMLAAPNDWKQIVENKRLSFGTVLSESADDILKSLLVDEYNRIERESLLVKTDVLFRQCKSSNYVSPTYQFDRSKLEEIDKARHSIIHHEGIRTPLPDFDTRLNYLIATGHYFMEMVFKHYSLRFDDTAFVGTINAMSGPVAPPMP